MKEYNLGVIQANIEAMLLKACEDHAKAIETFGEAHDIYSDDIVVYERAMASVTKRLKAEGEKVGVIKDIARGETAELKGKMLKSEGQMKRARMMVMALEERINAVKYVGRRLEIAEQNAR